MGSAQRRTRRGFLQHGSIRIRDDGHWYERILETKLPPPPPALQECSPERVARVLERAFEDRLARPLVRAPLGADESRIADRLESLRASDALARPAPLLSRTHPSPQVRVPARR